MYNFLKCMYNMGRLSAIDLQKYVSAGWITSSQYDQILRGDD